MTSFRLPHPLRTVLGTLTGEHIARIRLVSLSPKAVAQLAHSSGHDSQHVYNVTGGNPFFVREILAAPSNTVPETVRDAVLSRLSQCSKEARRLAELVSVMPGGTELWLARAIFGDVAAAVDAAVACGLLDRKAEMLTFRHELGRAWQSRARSPSHPPKRSTTAFWQELWPNTMHMCRGSCTTLRAHPTPRRCSNTLRAPRQRRREPALIAKQPHIC